MGEDYSQYSHSPAHLAVVLRDHVGLRRLIAGLPHLPRAGEIATEEQSRAADLAADAVSAVIDSRDVPGGETPLHLAARLGDPSSAEILMSAGADASLQNANGWSALQEAVCAGEPAVAMIVARQHPPLAWAKWSRRLPRIAASVARVRDFYTEIGFHLESSVVPFIGRMAPPETYRIWKRGAKLRADVTVGRFDGFRFHRSEQTLLFLGDGSSTEGASRQLSPGSLIVLSHGERTAMDALEGVGKMPTDAEAAYDVGSMSQTNIYRPAIDVTQAELLPHSFQRREDRIEMIGDWRTKVFDMHRVVVSVKSRKVPGAMTDEQLLAVRDHTQIDDSTQTNSPLQMGGLEGFYENDGDAGFSGSNLKNSSNLDQDNGKKKAASGKGVRVLRREKCNKKKSESKGVSNNNKHVKEYKKDLKPVLWLTPDFPLKTDELLPVLDVLADKIKAVRRIREILTMKLPQGTFPVKVVIPLFPTIRVVITCMKFECSGDRKSKETEASCSWNPRVVESQDLECSDGCESRSWMQDVDLFSVPSDYAWISPNEKKRVLKAKKAKKKLLDIFFAFLGMFKRSSSVLHV